jgi:iron complex outermembrane receptor protein
LSVDHAVSIDPLVADQIEIFRGPTTLLYGSGAIGGVINTVTTRIPEYAPDDGFEGAFELRGDSVSNDRSGAVRLDGGGDRFAWHFDALTRDTDNYDIPGFADQHALEEGSDEVEGILENSDIEVDSAAVGGSWLGANGFFGVSVSTFATNYGVPGHHDEEGAEEEEEEPAVRIDLDQTRVDLKGGWAGFAGGIEAVNLRFGINDYEHVELEGGETGTLFNNDAYEGRIELLHAPWGGWNGAFGLQFSDREFSAIGEEAFVPPVETRSYGIFWLEQRDLERWQVSFGARFEQQEHEPSSGPTVDDTATSLSFAGVRELGNDYSLVLNLALAERLPVAEELYAFGPHLASGAIEIGDPSLTEETAQHFDIGIRKSAGDLTWSVTAFFTSYDDFIFLSDTGVVDPDEELPIFAFAQQGADLQGLEAELFTPVATVGEGELDLRIYADYVEGELSNGENLPRVPPLRYGSRLQYHDERFLAGVEATRYDDQDETAPFEEPTGGYTMVNADFTWQLATARGVELDLFVRGTNLTDEDARKHTSLVKEIAPLPGRNYSVGVRSRF